MTVKREVDEGIINDLCDKIKALIREVDLKTELLGTEVAYAAFTAVVELVDPENDDSWYSFLEEALKEIILFDSIGEQEQDEDDSPPQITFFPEIMSVH